MSDLVGNPEDRFSHDKAHTSHSLIKPSENNLDQPRGKPNLLSVFTQFGSKSPQFLKLYEPHHEKTNILHMRKQRRRSASR